VVSDQTISVFFLFMTTIPHILKGKQNKAPEILHNEYAGASI